MSSEYSENELARKVADR